MPERVGPSSTCAELGGFRPAFAHLQTLLAARSHRLGRHFDAEREKHPFGAESISSAAQTGPLRRLQSAVSPLRLLCSAARVCVTMTSVQKGFSVTTQLMRREGKSQNQMEVVKGVNVLISSVGFFEKKTLISCIRAIRRCRGGKSQPLHTFV